MADEADSTLRACKHCKIEKPLSAFDMCGGYLKWACRDCVNAKRRSRYSRREGQYAKHDTEAEREKRRANERKRLGRYVWDASWLNHQPTKVCGRCDIELPANPAWFRTRTNSPTGLHSWCRACEARHWDENKAKRIATSLECERRRREASPVEFRAKARARRKADPERAKAVQRRWYSENIHRERARGVVHENNRRARKRNAPGKFTQSDVQAMHAAQKGRCWYCVKSMTEFHIEHRIPLSRGGSNGPENLVLACPPCNQSKGVKMPWEMETPRLL